MIKGNWTTLAALRNGAIFETREGIRAVKSEYCYSNAGKIQCVLTSSGEYAHFSDDVAAHNRTRVREIQPYPVGLDDQAARERFLLIVMGERDKAVTELRFYESAFTDFQRLIRQRRKNPPQA